MTRPAALALALSTLLHAAIGALVDAQPRDKVRLRVRFVSGPRPDFERDPPPLFRPRGLEFERRRRVERIQIGKTEVFGSNSIGEEEPNWSDNENRSGLNLGWNIELESLLSAAHRRRYGWSGTKVREEQSRAFRDELRRLHAHYKQLGWI